MKSNDDAKINLFGEVKKASAAGGHQPDRQVIQEIINDGMAIVIFCTGCGSTQGLTSIGINSLMTEAGLHIINNPHEFLLACSRCPICSDTFENMTLTENK